MPKTTYVSPTPKHIMVPTVKERNSKCPCQENTSLNIERIYQRAKLAETPLPNKVQKVVFY